MTVRAQPTASAPPDADPPAATLSSTPDESEYGPPLVTAEERQAWVRTHGAKYRSALTTEHPGAAEKDELALGMRMALYSLTLYESENDAEEFRNVVRSLSDDLRRGTTKKEPRDLMNAELVRVAPDLLDKGPKSRLNAVIILASLIIEPPPTQGPPPRPYVPAFKVLLGVLNEPSQFVDCKIWAANGLGRICRDGEPGINDRTTIASDLAAALDAPQAKLPANWWYRMRLVDALGDSGLVFNLVQKPVVIDALMKVLTDPQEDFLIRSTAARAVTQLPWTATTNVPLIATEVARLAGDIGQSYNKQLAGNKGVVDPRSKWCFINVYMAFMPDTQDKMQKRWGLRQQVERPGLGVHKPFVEGTYQVVLPVVNAVIGTNNPVPIPNGALQNLGNWLQNNIQQNLKVTPESDELQQTERPPQPITGSGGPSARRSVDSTSRGVHQRPRASPVSSLSFA